MSEFSPYIRPRGEIIGPSETPTPDQRERAVEDAQGIAHALEELAGSGDQPGVLERLRDEPHLKDDLKLAQDFLTAVSHVKETIQQVEDDRKANRITGTEARDLIGDEHFAGLTGPYTSISGASVGGHRLSDIREPEEAKEYLGGLFQSETTPTAWFTKVKLPDMRDMIDGLQHYKG